MLLLGSKRFSTSQKVTGIALILAGMLGFSGCWVSSINPLYEESRTDISRRDPDIVFEPSLLGSWVDTSDRCSALTITSKDNEIYDFRSSSTDERCSESDKPTQLQARLVKLGTHYFMDITPIDEDVCSMCLPEHNIFLARFDKTALSLIPIDSDWLKKALAAKTVTLATLAGDTDTLTASSKDLKAFCRRYADDNDVFKTDSKDGARLVRK